MAYLIVEFTPSSVRGLHVQQGGWRMPTSQLFVEPLRNRTVAEALAGLMRRVGGTPEQVVSVIPREQTMTRMMSVPASDPQELRDIVELSGRTQFPYPAQKVLVDFHVAGQDNGTSTIQLVGCRRELIEQHLAQLRDAGLEPEVVTPSSWGILAWYQWIRRSLNNREPVCVVNVDADHTELVVIQDGRLLFSRVLGEGVRQWQGSFGSLEPLWQELKRSLSGARQDWPGLEIKTCVLTGLGPLEQYKTVVEEHLGASVIVHKATKEWAVASQSQEPVSPVVTLGLGSADPARLVNLLPQEIQRLHARKRLVRTGVQSAWLGLAACWLAVAMLAAHGHRQGKVLSAARAALQQLEATAAELSEQERYIRVAEGVLASRKHAAERLAALLQVTPADVAWKHVAFNRSGRTLVVAGSAPTTRRVLDYVQLLQQAKLWNQVELRYTSRRKMKSEQRTEFEIALQQESKG